MLRRERFEHVYLWGGRVRGLGEEGLKVESRKGVMQRDLWELVRFEIPSTSE